MSDTEIEERVRRRAYELWEEAGQPIDRGDEFWHRAWAEITSGDTSQPDVIGEAPP